MSRFNLEMNPRLATRLRRVPAGFRSAIVRTFLEQLCTSYEQHGEAVLGVLVAGDYELVPRFPTTGGKSTTSRRTKQ